MYETATGGILECKIRRAGLTTTEELLNLQSSAVLGVEDDGKKEDENADESTTTSGKSKSWNMATQALKDMGDDDQKGFVVKACLVALEDDLMFLNAQSLGEADAHSITRRAPT